MEKVLAGLRARLLETAEWLEKQKLPENESPYTASAGLTPKKGKRLEPLLTAFRDALNSGAFADDSEMQCERARVFPEDIADNADVPESRMRGNWAQYQSYGEPRLMFLERLMRGWLPDFDFGNAESIAETVVWQFRAPMTVPKYVEGLRCLARAVEKEMGRRCPARSENQNAGLAARRPTLALKSETHQPNNLADDPVDAWLPLEASAFCLSMLRALQWMRVTAEEHGGFNQLDQPQTDRSSEESSKTRRDEGWKLVTPGDDHDDDQRRQFDRLMKDLAWLRRKLPNALELLGLPAAWGNIPEPDFNGLEPATVTGWRPHYWEVRKILIATLQQLERLLTDEAFSRGEIPRGWQPKLVTRSERVSVNEYPFLPIRATDELKAELRGLQEALRSSQYRNLMLEDIRREIANAHNALSVWEVPNRPDWPEKPKDIDDAARQLQKLIDWITPVRKAEAAGDGGGKTSGGTSATPARTASTVVAVMAGTEKQKATSRSKTRQPYLLPLPFKPDDGVSAVVLFTNWILRRCWLLQEAVHRDIEFPREEHELLPPDFTIFRHQPCRVERMLSVWYPGDGGDVLRDLRFAALSEIREPHLFGVFHPLIESLWSLYAGFTEKAGQFLNLPYGQHRADLGRFDLGFLGQVCNASNAVFDQAGLLSTMAAKKQPADNERAIADASESDLSRPNNAHLATSAAELRFAFPDNLSCWISELEGVHSQLSAMNDKLLSAWNTWVEQGLIQDDPKDGEEDFGAKRWLDALNPAAWEPRADDAHESIFTTIDDVVREAYPLLVTAYERGVFIRSEPHQCGRGLQGLCKLRTNPARGRLGLQSLPNAVGSYVELLRKWNDHRRQVEDGLVRVAGIVVLADGQIAEEDIVALRHAMKLAESLSRAYSDRNGRFPLFPALYGHCMDWIDRLRTSSRKAVVLVTDRLQLSAELSDQLLVNFQTETADWKTIQAAALRHSVLAEQRPALATVETLDTLRQFGERLLDSIRKTDKRDDSALEKLNFAFSPRPSETVLNAIAKFVESIREIPRLSNEFDQRIAADRRHPERKQGCSLLAALADARRNDDNETIRNLLSNNLAGGVLTSITAAVNSLFEFVGIPQSADRSNAAAGVESSKQSGADNRDRQTERRSVKRRPAFERLSSLPDFDNFAQELLYGPGGESLLLLPRMDGFEGHIYFTESDITDLLTEVRRYCPNFDTQQWLANPDPSSLLIEMKIALERRKTAEASGQGSKGDDGAGSKLVPKVDVTTNVKQQKTLQPAELQVYYAHRYAELKMNEDLEAPESYRYWCEHGFDPNDSDMKNAELLRNFDPQTKTVSTYASQLTRALRHPDINEPRNAVRKHNQKGQKRRNGRKMDDDGT